MRWTRWGFLPELEQKAARAKARAFLAAYRVCCNVTEAAAAAGIEKTIVYRWKKKSAGFLAAFNDAHEQGVQAMEDEATHRAMIGVFEPTVYQGEFTYPASVDPQTGEVTRSDTPVGLYKKSDGLLIARLRAESPKYAARVQAEVNVTGSLELVERLNAARKRTKKE